MREPLPKSTAGLHIDGFDAFELRVFRGEGERPASRRKIDAELAFLVGLGGACDAHSLGGFGGTTFTPIINAPEVAILGVCRSAMKPVWDGKAFQPRLMVPLSLSYDHRVIDGASAAKFNTFLASLLADFRRALV